jgi:hypothetical protein
MHEKELEDIEKIVEELEEYLNKSMKSVVEQFGTGVSTNVLINLGTSMIAKAMILVHPEARPHVQYLTHQAIDQKVEEGYAAVVSLMTISKAMGGQTCQPMPPRKD